MLGASGQIRKTRYLAVLASVLTCVAVPAAMARGQNSSSDATAPEAASRTTDSTAGKSGTATHRKKGTASHKGSSPVTSKTSVKTASATHHSSRRSSRKSKTKRVRGQQKIDSERAASIQTALIREHYLSGQPSGVWDAASEAAMRKYQSDHGWQTKEVPDSRALITLGLGPSNDHLLNPESAMTSTPIAPRSYAPSVESHTSDAPAAGRADTHPSAKPASTPAAQPTPAPPPPVAPPKDSDDSADPQ